MKTRTHTIGFLLLCSLVAQALSAKQHNPFGEIKKANENSTLNMHLLPEGEFEVSRDQWGDIVRVNMLKIKDWSRVPGVKKAWVMKGFEGEDDMAFHPVISEVKDVDGDGKADIFRCRSEHEGARIERLRYDDGAVVWQSEPMAALHGDESRLPVFDLDGDTVYSVLHATQGGTWCINAQTGQTEWSVKEAIGDIIVGHFLDRKKQAVVVRSHGILRCYDHRGHLTWTHDTGLKGGDAYAHEAYRHDADNDGLDEIFANWQKLTMALKGDGTVLWEDRTQRHHSDYIVCADVDADGNTELIYDHEGCDAQKGPVYVVDPMTGTIENKIDYRKDGLGHAQNMAVGEFDPAIKGLEIAICAKNGNLHVWDAAGKLLWKRHVPASLLSKGDWDGDGVEDIACFALGANIDGMFSVWNGQGERLYAISFLPSPSKRTWSDEHNGGSWSHAMPGGHEGVRRQVDLDGNGRADFIMPFGAWHWGSDAILFLMEGESKLSAAKGVDDLTWLDPNNVNDDSVLWQKAEAAVKAAMPQAQHDPTRPVYHFRSPAQWMNDICGAIYYNGTYHAFYQYNPFSGDSWGAHNSIWAHARSKDLVHWEELPWAFLPMKKRGEQRCNSGCVTLDDNGKPTIFYTFVPTKGKRHQWGLKPLDDDLIQWRRVSNAPLMAAGKNGIPLDVNGGWSDPFVFKSEGRTFVTFKSCGGVVCEAKNKALTQWEYAGQLEGVTGECPNFFPLQDKWVLIRSTHPISYVVGDFDARTMAFRASGSAGTMDYGFGKNPPKDRSWTRGLYGTNAFEDAKGRRVLLGWICGFKPKRGWNGCMSLPRILTLDKDQRLVQSPAPELRKLRSRHRGVPELKLNNTEEQLKDIAGDTMEILAEFETGDAETFGLKVRHTQDGKNAVTIRYTNGTLNVAGTDVPLKLPSGKLTLHVFIDKSVLEVFINNGVTSVTRVNYPGENDLGVSVFAGNGKATLKSLDAWEMKPIWQ